MAKRNTVIGTRMLLSMCNLNIVQNKYYLLLAFWMAPEVIEEIGYDCVADIWSLGITALECAEGKPPYVRTAVLMKNVVFILKLLQGDIHPMRAIFMIPTKPPPSFRDIDRWSPEFIDFVSICLVKNPEERATATDLLQHEFVKSAKSNAILVQMIAEAKEIRDNQSYRDTRAAAIQQANKQLQSQHEAENADTETLNLGFPNCDTLIPSKNGEGDLTMIAHEDCNTLIPDSGTMVELQSNLGTMVINSDSEDTMKRHDTNPDKPKYRPLFLEHFDKKEAESHLLGNNSNFLSDNKESLQEVPKMTVPAKNTPQQIQQQLKVARPTDNIDLEETQLQQQLLQTQLNLHLNQIQQSSVQQQGHPISALSSATVPTQNEINENIQHQINQQHFQQQAENILKYQRLNTLDSDYEFVSSECCRKKSEYKKYFYVCTFS